MQQNSLEWQPLNMLDTILTRRSIRKYQDLPIEWDKLGVIAECANQAPCAGNLQSFRFIMVIDEAKKKQIAEACLQQSWMEKAPVHFVVCADIKKVGQFYGSRGERLYSVQDASAATENALLAAHALGLGTCWVGAFDEDMLKRILGIPDWARPEAVITMGYPDERPPQPAKYKVEVTTFLDFFWNRIRTWDLERGEISTIIEDVVRKGVKSMNKSSQPILGKLKERVQKAKGVLKEKIG